MLLDFPSPILTVSPDALKHLDGDGAIKSLWYLFTKCKGSLHDGPRLENISWRLWYQEMAATGSYRPLTPNSPSSEVTDRPFVLSQACIISRQPIGQVIYEMLPGSSPNTTQTLNSKLRIPVEKRKVAADTQPVALLPTPAAELLSISIIPQESCPVPLPQSPQPAVVAPASIPGISTTNLGPTSTSAPTTNSSTQSCLSVAGNVINSRAGPSFFPRVVVVNPTPNPTPHPTPPATPIPLSVSLQLPVTVSVARTDPLSLSSSSQMVPGKLLIPPVHLLQPTPTSSSNSNMLNPNCTSGSPSRTNGPHSTVSTQKSPALEKGKLASDPQPGTGTFSASHPVVTGRAAVLTASETQQSNSSKPSSLEPILGNRISDSLLPISPDPSSSSVASFHNWTMTTNLSDHSSRAHTTDVTSSGAVPSDSKASSGDSRISVDGNTNKVIAHGNANGTVRGLPSSPDETSKRGDAGASSLAPKFFLSSTNASPSPGSGTNGSGGQSSFNSCSASGSSFGRRSDASHSELMSVSPLDGDASQDNQPLTRHQPSRSDGDVAIPNATGSTLSQPYVTTGPSSSSSSSHSRTTRRTTAQSNSHHYPYHATHNYAHNTQKDIPRRGKSKSISGSRSRSRNRIHDGLTMTSTAVPVSSTSPRTKNATGTSDIGGAKPRPRRKGSGEGGATSGRAVGDRGRFARPYGYGIYQVLTQSQNQSNAGPSTQNQKPSQGTQQQAKRMLFRVGNGDDDDDDWEDDDSSSLSRSLSQSQSRSRSRSSRSRRMSSRSPVLTAANGTQGPRGSPIQHVRNETLNRVSSPPQLPAHTQDTSQHCMQPGPLTESPLPQDTHLHLQPSRQISSATISQHAVATSETSQLAGSQQRLSEPATAEKNDQGHELKKEGVVGAVVGPNGRKIVVIATDEDEDEDDYDDDDDWEEEDEEDDDAGDSKTNNAPTDITGKASGTTGTNTAAPEVARASDPVPPGHEETIEDDEGWTSASSVENESSNLPETGTTAKAPTTVTTIRNDATHGNGTVTDATVQHNKDNWHNKEKGKQKAPQPVSKGPPRHYPNPPPPQVLQRAQSSKFVGPAGLGFTQQQTQKNPGARPKDTAQARQHHVGHGHPPSSRQPRYPSVDMSEAALEAQRQLEMFAKKPKRAWSGLARSGSGLLSQLMNPDPEIFPANHPYRRGYSSGDVGMPKSGVTRLGIAPLTPVGAENGGNQYPAPNEVRKGGISAAAPPATAGPRRGDAQIGNMRPQAPGLQPSKSAVALPLADNVTAASVKDNTMGARPRDGQQQKQNRVGNGGVYRPKRRPEDQEMEDTDTEEDDQPLEMSKSAAQAKLALVLGRKGAAKQQPQHQRPSILGRSTTDPTSAQVLPPSQIQRTQSQHVPGSTATTTAPMPLGYPYNLPLAAPPSSPRTTRQLMLRKEMSESLRANLLWSRQLSRAETIGPRRLSSANVSGQWDNNYNHNYNHNGNGNGNVVKPSNTSEGSGDSNAAPTNTSQFPTLVQLSAKRRPGRGVMVDAVGVGEPSIQDVGWAGDRPLNPRRKSSAAVPGLRNDQVDGEGIHVGGGANVVTRTRSWGGLAGGTGGMTRMF
ncbi:hypothetical protein WG66_007784 [Moniliophthora roreri]|nr:hypothetical protein WG66_007784 [Moniliophthora roreri]